MTKGGKQEVAAVGHNSYAGTRFNAVKHAVLSRYTVLPWDDAGEYEGLFSALVEEHMPEGPTETHLVEEVAGIFWRKRRLRLAEASAIRSRRLRQKMPASSSTRWVSVGPSGLCSATNASSSSIRRSVWTTR